MCTRGWRELTRSSLPVRIALIAAIPISALFCVALVITSPTQSTGANYQTLTLYATQGILPVTLLLQLVGGVRYGTFERCRSDPAGELYANIAWLMQIALAGGVWSVLVFAGLETLMFGRALQSETISLMGVLFVQIVMMTISVGAFVLLLVNCGLPFGHVVPPVIACFALAKWLLEPFVGDLPRYAYYFWYPISTSWQTVLTQQVIPCCGYCLLMGCAIAIAFSRTDRLEA